MNVLTMISILKPGERMQYPAPPNRIASDVFRIHEQNPTIVLTQHKTRNFDADGRAEYIYYANKISEEASEKIDALREGVFLHEAFKDGVL